MIAALFPGQGTQRTGMGARFFQTSSAAKDVFTLASDVLHRDVEELCFRSSAHVLRDTRNAQVAIVVVSLAAFAVTQEWGLDPDVVAGHSVGQLAALAAAGALDSTEALLAAAFRGELMSSLPRVGGMVATRGLPPEKVDDVCRSANGAAVMALVNSDVDTVIAGTTEAIDSVTAHLETLGAQVRPLSVSHAFHSPLMLPVLPAWRAYVHSLRISAPGPVVVGNVSGEPLGTPDAIRDELTQQLVSCVRWRESMRAMSALGVTRAVEAGDTHVLAALCRATSPAIPVTTLRDLRRAQRVVRETSQCVATE